ncbi:acetyltransferase [Pseudalkalibacillus hwajinpoensis]|uniref:acetyltransferase n=1 Tax=Guptibacillus hwajinpoensis TaxID=208199 RepID=UPI001CFE84C1|nr:acetyltransferase [Pseudalkalibacillus hwajinpoensis]
MDVIVIGNGGHSKVIQDMIRSLNFKIIAVLDGKFIEHTIESGVNYAPIELINEYLNPDVRVVIAIGDNASRKKVSDQLSLHPEQYLTVTHPSSVVSSTACIGAGTVVMPNAVINANAIIGDQCIINTGAIIEHENKVNNYSHVSPNATLTGNVSTGEGVHIGASVTVIPGISIGNWSVVGAGATVIEDIPAFSTAVGCPAKIIRKGGDVIAQ